MDRDITCMHIARIEISYSKIANKDTFNGSENKLSL